MDKDDDYRRYAAEAQALSDKSLNQADKQSWLRIAQSWMQLIKRPTPPTPTEEQSFDAAATAQETHQKRSEESH